MELDHVLIAVADLAAATVGIADRHGLAAVDGGRHPGWGTANMIVPLGDTYLELVAVVDMDEALGSTFGRWVAAGQDGRPLGWAVRVEALGDVTHRLDLTPRAGSRQASNGAHIRWRTAGIDHAAADPSLPFFIEWAQGTELPGRAPTARPQPATRIAKLDLRGDAARVSQWLGPHSLPIEVRAGAPAVVAVHIRTAGGTAVIGASALW